MSYEEVSLWIEYRRKFGPLDPVRKYDKGFALVAALINNSHGGKAKPKDFLPYGKEPEQDVEIGSEEFTQILLLGGKRGR